MILVDTSGLLALLDAGEPRHADCRAAVAGASLVTIDLVLAETDFLLLSRLGREAEARFLDQLARGTPIREPLGHDDLARAVEIERRYADHALGLTDSALMAVAERLGARVLTLDRRHFPLFRTRRGRPLALLP